MIDEVGKTYESSKKCDIISRWLFVGNVIISLIILLFQGDVCEIILNVQMIVIMINIGLNLLDNGICWYNAEKYRRHSAIEKAFGMDITGYKTEGYYNNEYKPSIKKYIANIFESCFFSLNIAKEMRKKTVVKFILQLLVFIFAALQVRDKNLLLFILQVIFSAELIENEVMFFIYTYRLQSVYDNLYRIVITQGIKDSKSLILAWSYAVEYEVIKAYYKIRLSEEEYNRLNDVLSEKWDRIQSDIQSKESMKNDEV